VVVSHLRWIVPYLRLVRLAAKGRITDEELDEELAALEDTRKAAKRELQVLRGQKEHLEQIERDRDAVLSHYATLAPEALDSLTSEERHRLYRMLRLKVWVAKSGDLEIEMAGVPIDDVEGDGCYTLEVTSIQTPGFRRMPELKFRVMLEDWAQASARTCASAQYSKYKTV
jgi:hypothetical protein